MPAATDRTVAAEVRARRTLIRAPRCSVQCSFQDFSQSHGRFAELGAHDGQRLRLIGVIDVEVGGQIIGRRYRQLVRFPCPIRRRTMAEPCRVRLRQRAAHLVDMQSPVVAHSVKDT